MKKIPKVALLIETSSAYGRRLLLGISKYARLHGPWLLRRVPPHYHKDFSKRKKILVSTKEWGPDGVIIREVQKGDEILFKGTSVIVSSSFGIQGLPSLCSDYVKIGKLAAEHLLKCNLHNFAYCGFDETYQWSKKRGESFVKSIKEAGYMTYVYQPPKLPIRSSWEKEESCLSDWLRFLPKPVGIFACDDERAEQIIEVCRISELNVPGDIAILGVDNDEMICEFSDPPLSSISLGIEQVGYKAAKLLDQLMNGKKKMGNQKIVDCPSAVIARRSTQMFLIEDREVAKAVLYIRKNSAEHLSVDQVVDCITISRRSLERRFRKAIGCSIKEEITRIRLERICNMLTEADTSVSKIALALNFPSDEHISRYFMRNKGMTPLAYRKLYGLKLG